MIRPPESTAWFPPSAPSGYQRSDSWPTPEQVLSVLDSTTTSVPSEEQFGRYPGVAYETPRNELRWASPVPVSVRTEPAGQAAFEGEQPTPAPAEAQHLESYGYTPSAGREGGLAGDSSAAPSAPPAAEDRGGWPGQA